MEENHFWESLRRRHKKEVCMSKYTQTLTCVHASKRWRKKLYFWQVGPHKLQPNLILELANSNRL